MELGETQLKLKSTIKRMLVGDPVISFDKLEDKTFGIARVLFDELSDKEVQEVIAELTHEHTVTLAIGGAIVDDKTFEPWLASRKETVLTPRWDAYEQLLISRDWEVNVIEALDKQTDELVELLGDPTRDGSWSRRGLVMGEVQSGKTATYLGVLNKALDYGYRVVIVIGGHTNELRRQTQSRFDTDLLGIDSEYIDDNIANAKLPRVGIGRVDTSLRANVLTTVRGDFGVAKKTAGITWVEDGNPTVFVIKKNATLIRNVANYIRQQAPDGMLSIPLVVVDDEADWGTPNTGTETDPTRVNQEIRRLLGSSRRSTYLGITATPFANIFIDHEAVNDETGEDLFPSDFIRVMEPPSTYFGVQTYFDPVDPAVNTEVEDCTDLLPILHKSTHEVAELPQSLKRAIVQFALGTAIRRVRRLRAKPAAMLVNVSRFNDVQAQVSELVAAFVDRIRAVVVAEFQRDATVRSVTASFIEEVWAADFAKSAGVAWSDVEQALVQVLPDFRVALVNSKTASARLRARRRMTKEQRADEDRRPTIFVGGDVLSRGLTLDGLQVSYFVREPRTMDTLIQMGRWFGYRPGFADLVRIWIPDTTAATFEWSAVVTDELRDMLFQMRARDLTPRDFGLRVRTHPDGFGIVAANKAKSSAVVHEGPILWANRLEELRRLPADREILRNNFRATSRFVDRLIEQSNAGTVDELVSVGGYQSWHGVDIREVYRFLREFRGDSRDPFWGVKQGSSLPPIAASFADAKGNETWSVALVSGAGDEVRIGGAGDFGASIRNKLGIKDGVLEFQNRRVAAPNSLPGALSPEQVANGEAVGDAHARITQSQALRLLDHPALLVFAMVTDEERRDPSPAFAADDPLVSIAVAFPHIDEVEALALARRARKYQVNTVWLRTMLDLDIEDGDDIDRGDPE